MKKIWLGFSILVFLNILWVAARVEKTSLSPQEPAYPTDGPFFTYLPFISKVLPEYFVSPNGNDSNPGTLQQPWKTIGKAARTVSAGYTVYIRQGTYVEAVKLNTSGTAANPIKVIAYPNENPVIDGGNSIPEPGGCLLCIQGDYIQVSGIEVRNSIYIGILVYGSYDLVDNMYAHHNQEAGILLNHGAYSTVQNSRVWRNALLNEYGQRGSGGFGLSAGRNGVTHATIRGNTVWENWGEGISSFEADHTTIEDNIAHDNWSTNIYISDSTNVLCQRNFVYENPTSYLFPYGGHVGILLGDEKYTPPSANITILNNIAYGNLKNFSWYMGVQGGGMNNVLIANNTFVNSLSNDKGHCNVDISSGTHQNVRFFNNLILQENILPIEDITDNPQVVLSHNLWSKSPRTAILGTGDIIADPKLARTGDNYSPGWYRLTSLSPAISNAQTIPEVLVDYFKSLRDAYPDIGAIEFYP
jgi:hypothetical protein